MSCLGVQVDQADGKAAGSALKKDVLLMCSCAHVLMCHVLGMGGWVSWSAGLSCPSTQGGSVPGLCPAGRRTCSVRIQQNLNKDKLDVILCIAGEA